MKCVDESIPFGKAKELIVDVPVDPRGFVDVYIDNLISLAMDKEDYAE